MSRTELFFSYVSAPPVIGLADPLVNGSAALEVNVCLSGEHSIVLTWHDTTPKTTLRVELGKPSMYYQGEESTSAADSNAEHTEMDELIMDRLLSIAWNDESHLASVLGTTVKEWRQDRGLTRRDFARALDVSVDWLTAFENGGVTADELNAALINDMAQTLDIEPIALELLAELDEDKLWEEVERLRERERQEQKRECSHHP